jgi:hypothetical protein
LQKGVTNLGALDGGRYCWGAITPWPNARSLGSCE